MSLPLTPQDEASYTSIIDAILATADLNTVTRKKIRQGLERALGGKDLGPHKNAIKNLIEARFDAISGASQDHHSPDPQPDDGPTHSPNLKRQSNGHPADDIKDESSPTPDDDDEPARKKVKRDPSIDDDARLAAELQAQEDRMSRGRRATRGAGNGGAGDAGKKKKKAPKKKKMKSEKKIKGEGDSEAEGSGDEEGDGPVKKKGGGFQKPFNLSYPLAEICGESQLSRPQVVKRLWEHIKSNELQDPEDKRQILCDDKLMAVFKQARVSMFGMNKLISSHLYPVEEE